MRAIFHTIRWKNFQGTGNYWTQIDFDTGSTLVIGKNGHGKSQLLDGLFFVLFNKPFRKINKPQLVNTITGKGTMVELTVTVAGVKYLVRRGIKPNLFEIHDENGLIDQTGSDADYQQILENITGLKHKSARQIVVMGSANYVEFMELKAEDRRSLVEDILDLEIITHMNILLKKEIEIHEQQLAELQTKITPLEIRIAEHEKHVEWVKNKSEKRLDELETKKVGIRRETVAVHDKLAGMRKEAEQLLDQITDEDGATKELAEISNKMRDLLWLLKSADQDIQFYTTNDHCPSCEQPIAEQHKHNKLTKAQELQTKAKQTEKEFERNVETIRARLREITAIKTRLKDIELKSRQLIESIRNADRDIGWIDTAIKDEKERATKELRSVDDDVNELEKVKVAEAVMRQQAEVHQSATLLLKDGGIKAQVIRQYIPVINELLNQYLSKFNLLCEFILDENFNETIRARYRDEYVYNMFSQGEKKRIDLSILFAWREIAKLRGGSDTNILIFDEVLDSSMDQDGVDDLLKIITGLAADQHVMVVSHRGEVIGDKFDRVIRFEKKKGFSYVV